jgi:hypothetical protein
MERKPLPDDLHLPRSTWCGCSSPMKPIRESHAAGARYASGAHYRCQGHPERRAGLTNLRHRLDELVELGAVALVTDPRIRQTANADAR